MLGLSQQGAPLRVSEGNTQAVTVLQLYVLAEALERRLCRPCPRAKASALQSAMCRKHQRVVSGSGQGQPLRVPDPVRAADGVADGAAAAAAARCPASPAGSPLTLVFIFGSLVPNHVTLVCT